MLNKSNILDVIASLDSEIEELRIEAQKSYPASVQSLIKNKIGNLENNRYLYGLQARAWGIKVD